MIQYFYTFQSDHQNKLLQCHWRYIVIANISHSAFYAHALFPLKLEVFTSYLKNYSLVFK